MKFLTLMLAILFFTTSAGATARVDISGIRDLSTENQTKFNHWLSDGLSMVEHTLGPLPQRTLPVRIKTKRFATEPVPWGQVERDQHAVADGLYLVVYRNARAKQLRHDWTLYHEISHLYLPYLDYRSFWLSEGFATYIQNVIMLQNGIYSRTEFMRRLQAGLDRGRKNTLTAAGPLSDITQKMRANRAFMRVYWSGAAFFIEADLALQKQNTNLTRLIQTFNRCCRQNIETGKQLLSSMDKAQGLILLSPLYLKYRDRRDFPSISNDSIARLAEYYGSVQPAISSSKSDSN